MSSAGLLTGTGALLVALDSVGPRITPGESRTVGVTASSGLCGNIVPPEGGGPRPIGEDGSDTVERVLAAERSEEPIPSGTEEEEEKAFVANALVPELMARVCARARVPLVLIGTDFVFDGRKSSPYRPEDPPAPLSAYGRTKLEGERRARAAHPS